MDPVRDLNLDQMQVRASDSLTKGLAPKVIEKMETQVKEALSVLQGKTAPNAVNHRCRSIAIIETTDQGLMYIPSARSITSNAKGVLVTVAHPAKKKSVTKLIRGAKSGQVIRY